MKNKDFQPEKRVVVVGAAGLDMIGRIKGDPVWDGDNPAGIRISYGGVGRNVAENLARLGQPVSLITVLGDDPSGKQLMDYTVGSGVDMTASKVSAKHSTSAYLAVMERHGIAGLSLYDMGIMSDLTPQDLEERYELFERSDLVFVDANLSTQALKTVFSIAQRAHIPVCADTTSLPLARKFRPFLKKIFLLSANASEAASLCECADTSGDRDSTLAAARTLVNRGVGMVVAPMAQFGVCYASSETNGHVPAIRTAILDPTGAGDALTATVIFGILNDIPLDEAVLLGVSASSLTLRTPGTVISDLSLEMLYDQLV